MRDHIQLKWHDQFVASIDVQLHVKKLEKKMETHRLTDG